MLTKHCENSSDSAVSVALSSMAFSSVYAKAKILHDTDFNPYAYSIGFGNAYSTSVILGGVSDTDEITTMVLIKLAQRINNAMQTNQNLMGVSISKLLTHKGVWIIPSFKECKNKSAALNLISEKISPARLLEVSPGEKSIKYIFGKKTPTNTRLMAFLLAASSGYNITREATAEENSICSWYVSECKKPAYKISIGEENILYTSSEIEAIYQSLLEAFILFIAA